MHAFVLIFSFLLFNNVKDILDKFEFFPIKCKIQRAALAYQRSINFTKCHPDKLSINASGLKNKGPYLIATVMHDSRICLKFFICSCINLSLW